LLAYITQSCTFLDDIRETRRVTCILYTHTTTAFSV